MKASIRFGRLFGIEIGAHASWLIILVLVTLSLTAYFADAHPDWPRTVRVLAAAVTSFLFFGSVVAHELAHSLVARRFGVGVRAITLFLFGGVAQIESDARRPSHEFWIAAVGPLSSLLIAALCWGVERLLGGDTVPGAVVGWLWRINLSLAVFNLLPAFPLDGGRVLRGIVWAHTGDQWKATRIAATGGRILATLMILGGIWMFFSPGRAGGNLGGLWIAFLGWFLLDAARAGEAQVEMRMALRGVTAGDLMTTDWPHVPPDLTLDRFVADHLLRTGRRCFLVTDHGRMLGLVTASDLKAVERERWPELTVGQVMKPLEALQRVDPKTGADRVLEILGREEVNQVPVMSNGRLEGIVSREHLIRMLTTRTEFAG
jgi:Zn-dependent protease/predicted transcriptional regulator